MQVVRPICCGADIHKDIIVATIATSNQNGIAEYIQRKFCTQNYDLINLKSWLKEHNCFEFAMESTGKYWIPIFNVLEDEIKVYVVHPKYTKSIKGKKTRAGQCVRRVLRSALIALAGREACWDSMHRPSSWPAKRPKPKTLYAYVGPADSSDLSSQPTPHPAKCPIRPPKPRQSRATLPKTQRSTQ